MRLSVVFQTGSPKTFRCAPATSRKVPDVRNQLLQTNLAQKPVYILHQSIFTAVTYG